MSKTHGFPLGKPSELVDFPPATSETGKVLRPGSENHRKMAIYPREIWGLHGNYSWFIAKLGTTLLQSLWFVVLTTIVHGFMYI